MEGERKSGGKGSERQGRNQEGQREERQRDTLEEGGLNVKSSRSERAPVERTGRSQRGGFCSNPLSFFRLVFFAFGKRNSVSMGNRGSREPEDSEGRCLSTASSPFIS